MFVVIYSARAKSPEDAQAICTLFHADLALHLSPGYTRGECAINVDDPCAVLVVQYWGTEGVGKIRRASDDSRRVLASVEAHVVSPVERAVYEIS